MNIWLFAGYAGSGKTTAATCFQSHIPHSRMTAFAKRVKDDVAKEYGINRSMMETQEGKASRIPGCDKTVRDCLIEYSANHKVSTNDPGIWARYVKEEIEQNPTVANWIIHDWRYFAEYSTIRAILNAKVHTVRVVKSSVKPSESPSEHELDCVETDYVIQNNVSLQELDDMVKHIIESNRT